jgi:CubicO group peptidase (beta-lactamase class C family)
MRIISKTIPWLAITTIFLTWPPFLQVGNLHVPVSGAINVKITNSLSDYDGFGDFEQAVTKFLKANNIRGASVGLMYKGRLVFAKGIGIANDETNEEAQAFNTFRIASVSKWVTALGIMKLVEQGRLSLDDQVFGEKGILSAKSYAAVIKDPKYDQIKVSHLLYHTSGWNTASTGDPMFKTTELATRVGHKGIISQEDVFAFSLSNRLHYAPGQKYSYSNLGYALLGKIIEEVSGQNYEEFIKQEFLQPLGIRYMALTGVDAQSRKYPEVKHFDHLPGTTRSNAYGLDGDSDRIYLGTHYQALEGAGAWSASAADLLRLLSATDGNPSKPDLLRKDIIEKMLEPNEPGDAYIGWLDVKGETWKRTGTLIGTNALLVRLNEDVSYAIINNTSHWKGSRFNTEMFNFMNQQLSGPIQWPDYDLFQYYSLPGFQALAPRTQGSFQSSLN